MLGAYGTLILAMRTPLYDFAGLRPYPPDEGFYKQVRSIPGLKECFIPTGDGSRLHAWLFNPKGSGTLVIVHHGNAGNVLNRLYLASAILPCGSAVLLYDYRGYGKSTGQARLANLVDDGLSAYDYALAALGFTPDQIINFGESIGTGVACQVASLRPCAGLVLQSAIGSVPRVVHARLPLFRLVPAQVFPEPHLDNVEQIKYVRVPVLMFHGTSDELVPFEHSQIILSNCNAPKQLIAIPRAGHNDNPADSRIYRQALCRYLNGLGRRSVTQHQFR